MPIFLEPRNRRDFLKTTLATGAAGLFASSRLAASEAEQVDPHRFALLADLHIAAKASLSERGVNMTDNLRRVGGEVLKESERPAAVLVGGDCAYSTGRSADYTHLVDLLEPLRAGGIPIHLALGNHDHRKRFRDVLSPQDAARNVELDRHLTVLESPRANWILLDSLQKTNYTPGALGEAQRDWLAKTLDERDDRPAIVLVHHQPDERENTKGLTDTKALLQILAPRKHVKALLFGHTHSWSVRQQDGLHLVNLPPVAYVFAKGRPNGWIDAHLEEDGLALQLRCLDRAHPLHGKTKQLAWRDD